MAEAPNGWIWLNGYFIVSFLFKYSIMKNIFYLILLSGIILVSCEKDDTNTNNDSILTLANINGQVSLYDEFGNTTSSERMFVKAEGNSQNYIGETQKDGSVLIPNVPYFHNYTISYEKEGFGTYKVYGFEHEYTGAAGEIDETPRLSKKSSAYCTALFTNVVDEDVEFQLAVAGGSDGGKRVFRLLFHTITLISNETFSHHSPKYTLSSNSQSITLTKEMLEEMGLESGISYYVQAYGDSYYSNSYFDEYAQRKVLPNLGFLEGQLVPTASFIMP